LFTYIGGDNFPSKIEEENLSIIYSQQLLSETFPLSQGQIQARVVVVMINSTSETIELLRRNGLKQNTELLILNKMLSGSTLIQVNNNFLCLGAAIASQIIVKNILRENQDPKLRSAFFFNFKQTPCELIRPDSQH